MCDMLERTGVLDQLVELPLGMKADDRAQCQAALARLDTLVTATGPTSKRSVKVWSKRSVKVWNLRLSVKSLFWSINLVSKATANVIGRQVFAPTP